MELYLKLMKAVNGCDGNIMAHLEDCDRDEEFEEKEYVMAKCEECGNPSPLVQLDRNAGACDKCVIRGAR